MQTNCDLTIYNKYTDPTTRTEKYQRTVVVAVFWENRKAANIMRSGLLEADAVTVHIPFARGTDFVKPIAWQALTTKTGSWTIQVGDVIVKGAVTDEITDAVTDPKTHVVTPAFTMTDLAKKYDDVLTIRTVDTMDYGSQNMWHWEVGAK
jgi:hypothetical protein